jgi:hypothetical protein
VPNTENQRRFPRKAAAIEKQRRYFKYYIFLKYYAAAQVTLCERSELYVFLKQLLNIVRFLKFICSFTLKAISSSKQSQACAGGCLDGEIGLKQGIARMVKLAFCPICENPHELQEPCICRG